MNIDKESLTFYKEEKSSFSTVLKGGVDFKKSKFKSDRNGRCAFLDQKGLCEIIINLGEEKLCQVCKDHPRFRSFFSDRVETGLGFCCEEATRVILSFEGKIGLLQVDTDGIEQELDFNEKNVLAFRERALSILQERAVDINERISTLLKECKASISEKDFEKIIKAFLLFERVNKNFAKRLKAIKKAPLNSRTEQTLSHYAEQFLVNSIYRHLSDAEDTISVRARAIACVLSWWVAKSIIERESQSLDGVVDVIREFSVEVEYSEKNLQKLFDLSNKFIKI